MADPPSEWHKVTSITTADYLYALPTPSAGFGVLVVSKQTTYERLENPCQSGRRGFPLECLATQPIMDSFGDVGPAVFKHHVVAHVREDLRLSVRAQDEKRRPDALGELRLTTPQVIGTNEVRELALAQGLITQSWWIAPS
jgi:hypothetical protein